MDCEKLREMKLPNTLTKIEEGTFEGCRALEEVTLPYSVTEIGYDAFSNTGIKSFYCYATVPPQARKRFIGEGMAMENSVLYVPSFARDFYRNAENWGSFFYMRPIGEGVDYIYVDRPIQFNIAEEDSLCVAGKPKMDIVSALSDPNGWGSQRTTGQLTSEGAGVLSMGEMNLYGELGHTRARGNYNFDSNNYVPTIVNYADKMRADSVSHHFTFSNTGRWYFISLPYDVKVGEIVPGNDTYWAMRRYDGEARAAGAHGTTWVNLGADSIMEAGKGYIVSVAGGEIIDGQRQKPQLTFHSGNSTTKNNMFTSGSAAVALEDYPADFAHNRSWNLIGNPYPCYFSLNASTCNFTAPVTLWDGEDYRAYSPVDDQIVLAPYEAFFVQKPLESNNILFYEEGRMHHNEAMDFAGTPGIRTVACNIALDGRNVFNFELSDGKSSNSARIVLSSDAELTYEVARDAAKFFSDNGAEIYVSGDACYSICERPVADGIATLGVRAAADGVYTLSLNGKYCSDWHVIVTDMLTGNSVDLTEDVLEFSTTAGDAALRFNVCFTANEGGHSGIVDAFGAEAEVTVNAINGMTVYQGAASAIDVPSTGLYIVSQGNESRKAFLKK